MINPYQKSQSIKAESMSPQAQVAFVFERIADNLDYSHMCFEDKAYEKFFNHIQKAIELSNNLGQVINSIPKDSSEEDKKAMLPWVSYFESLVCSINRYSVTHNKAAKDKIVTTLKEMAKMWKQASVTQHGNAQQVQESQDQPQRGPASYDTTA